MSGDVCLVPSVESPANEGLEQMDVVAAPHPTSPNPRPVRVSCSCALPVIHNRHGAGREHWVGEVVGGLRSARRAEVDGRQAEVIVPHHLRSRGGWVVGGG